MAFIAAFVLLVFFITGCSPESKNQFYSFWNLPVKDAKMIDLLLLFVTGSFIGSFFK